MTGGKAPSQRQLRVGEEIRHALAMIFERGDLRDPALAGRMLTVTEVRVSPDLKNATAFVTPLGGGTGETMRAILDGLGRAAPHLRHELGRSVRLKFTPRLTFQGDQSFDEAERIDAMLRSDAVRRDLDAPGSGEAG